MRVVQAFEQPYPHFVADKVLDERHALPLAQWLASDEPEWRLVEKYISETWQLSLFPSKHPLVAQAFTPEIVSSLVAAMEKQFSTRLDKRVRLNATRMTATQSIGVHSDFARYDESYRDAFGLPQETHRLVIGLTLDYRDGNGGLAAIVSGPNADSPIARLIRPEFNTAYAFSQLRDSYHAVTEVTSGRRINVICYFYPDH
jgi:hypothetical protein